MCGPSWFCGCTFERAFTSVTHRDHWTPSFTREPGWGAGAVTPGLEFGTHTCLPPRPWEPGIWSGCSHGQSWFLR